MGLKDKQVHRILENLQRISLLINCLNESCACISLKKDLLKYNHDKDYISDIITSLDCSSECIKTKTLLLKEEHNALYNNIQGMLEASSDGDL